MFFGPKAMSLYTVSSKSWYSGYWKTRPTLKRTSRVASLLAKMSCPSQYTVPLVGASRPFRCCMKVLLPEPVWPMTATSSPGRNSTFTPCTAVFSNGVPTL